MTEKRLLEGVVSKDADIVSGALVFAGTRVPVQNLIDSLLGGDTIDDFREGFPGVSRDQIVAFLESTIELASNRFK